MEEEKDEDSMIVADVLDLEEEEVISSLISSLFPSTSLESVMDVETSNLTSPLEEVIPESSSKNSEIISATAEDFSVLVSGNSPPVETAANDRPSFDSPSSVEIFRSEIEVVAICCAEENSDFAEDFCSENVSVEDLFVNVSDASWDCWTDAASTVSMTEVFLVTTSLVDSE